MDNPRFDHLTRSVAQSLGRRRIAGLLTILGSGVLLSGLAIEGEAGKRKKHKKKAKKKRGGGCVPTCTGKACGADDGCGQPCPCSPPPGPPGPPCTPMCNGIGCGADDGCGQPCQTGTCPTNQTCRNGICVSTDGCNPPCPAGRSCYQGTCTCTSSAQCANERNPRGFDCVGAPGNPSVTICGCTQFAGLNRRVCVAGEPCSVCCSDGECRAQTPGSPDIICATIPVNGLVGRSCCDPPGSPCSSVCCSVSSCASGTQCGCRAGGQACGQHEQCCSLQCGTQADPFQCAP